MTEDREQSPWSAWRGRIQASRRRRDDRIGEWQKNVDRRYPLRAGTVSADVSVNQDWPLTKAKIAQLFSQTPQIRLTAKQGPFEALTPAFSRVLNDTLTASEVGAAIEEVLADVVNASGIGAVLVSCEHKTVTKELPVIDPSLVPPDQVDAIPTQPVTEVCDRRYPISRVSPADLLIPSDFTGSVYDQCRWLGYDGRMTWPQAVAMLGLTEDQKEHVLGADTRASNTNTLATDTMAFRDTDVVTFTELFYWTHYYDDACTSFKAIQRVVFVDGLEDPIINEPYPGQVEIAPGQMVGVTHLPIQVLTLTYISDENLPPSDSTIGRFQVNELEESRDAMVQQRKHSIPIRWFDTSRISGNTRNLLEKGTFQGFIPTQGPGDRAIGEVARASFPQEKFEFDRIIKADLSEIWQVGTNQAGAFASGERSASEAKIVQANFQTRVGQERDKVTKFFVRVAECLAGLLAIYDPLDGVQLPQGLPKEAIANGFAYAVRVDSTVLLDAEQQIERLMRGLNLTAQSGYVNPKKPIAKIWELLGEDPAEIVIDPQPKAPEPVKVSVSKAEDLMNPLFVATLVRTGQAPMPADLQAAHKLLLEAMMPSAPLPPPPVDGGLPQEGIHHPEIANPEWEAAGRVERRADDGGA